MPRPVQQAKPEQWPFFRQARLLILGDIMLDRYWFGTTERISPEAPVPVVRVRRVEHRLGGAANVAVNAVHLGCQVQLAGMIGQDDAGSVVVEMLAEQGIQADLQRCDSVPTITKSRILAQHQQLLRMDQEDPLTGISAEALNQRCMADLAGFDVLVLSDYAKGTLQQLPTLIAHARQQGVVIVVDPKGADFSRYRHATVVTPNLVELERIVGSCPDDRVLREKATALRKAFDWQLLLVTLGERGMLLVTDDQPPVHLPARAQEVYDVTGAGDTVVAVLAAGIAAGWPLASSAELANIAAGLVVGRVGTSSVTEMELRSAWRERFGLRLGVMDEATVADLVTEAQARGERVVMTNGCFDLLHAGHVAYLNEARALGDRLVVAVNNDASVARLKGAGRPINSLARRMAVLAGLRAVDWVVAFSEDTPERLICSLAPNVLVKGGDYRSETIAGFGCVTAQGGDVKVLSFLPNCSTTAIIDAIRTTTDNPPR